MKITSIEARLFHAPLVKPCVIALGTITAAETVVVRVQTEDGLTGYGEAAPYAPVTGETPQDALAFVGRMGDALRGMDACDLTGIHRVMAGATAGNTAGRACIDIALFDLAAKRAGLPLYRYLGGGSPAVHTDYTITLASPGEMASRAAQAVGEGFSVLKVKAGLAPAQDVENIAAVRRAVGPDVQIRIDANQGWDVKGALWALKAMEALGVAEAEQPLPAGNLDGLRLVRRGAAQRIMLDESVHSPADALRAVKAGAADLINIKLMKSAGILPALKIDAIAEAAGLPCMVGCMMETRLGIAAGAHLAAARPNIELADLDSHLEIADQACITGGFTQAGETLTLLDAPGLGVEVDFDTIS